MVESDSAPTSGVEGNSGNEEKNVDDLKTRGFLGPCIGSIFGPVALSHFRHYPKAWKAGPALPRHRCASIKCYL